MTRISDDFENLGQRMDAEFDKQNLYFSHTMKLRVMERVQKQPSKLVVSADRPHTSIWEKRVTLPLPVVLLPVVICMVFGAITFAERTEYQPVPALQVVTSQGGSMYSLNQLTLGGPSE